MLIKQYARAGVMIFSTLAPELCPSRWQSASVDVMAIAMLAGSNVS
jgi:hypothetical protein